MMSPSARKCSPTSRAAAMVACSYSPWVSGSSPAVGSVRIKGRLIWWRFCMSLASNRSGYFFSALRFKIRDSKAASDPSDRAASRISPNGSRTEIAVAVKPFRKPRRSLGMGHTIAARGKSRHGIRPSLHRARTALLSAHILPVCSLRCALVRRAQERSRCSWNFHHGLLALPDPPESSRSAAETASD